MKYGSFPNITDFLLQKDETKKLRVFGGKTDLEHGKKLLQFLQGGWRDARCSAVTYFVDGSFAHKYFHDEYERSFDLNLAKHGRVYWGLQFKHRLAASLGDDTALWANKKNEIIWQWHRIAPPVALLSDNDAGSASSEMIDEDPSSFDRSFELEFDLAGEGLVRDLCDSDDVHDPHATPHFTFLETEREFRPWCGGLSTPAWRFAVLVN